MPWTEITRAHYQRAGLCFASDTTDAEWSVLAPLMPSAAGIGRPRTSDLRAVVNGIFYVLWTGCPWRALPKGFPPRSTVQGYFYRWRDDGTWHCINRTLVRRAREAGGRKAAPSACIIDSQSAKTTESGGPRGFDAAKKVKGRKRHIVTDTEGSLLEVPCTPPMCKTITPPCRCCEASGDSSRDCATCSQTGSTAGRSCSMHLPTWASGQSTSSPERRPSAPSSQNRDDGSSSARLPGSAVTGGWPRTSNAPSPAKPLGF